MVIQAHLAFGRYYSCFAGHCPLNFLNLINLKFQVRAQMSAAYSIFYGDLVYKFRRIVGNPNFNDQFKKIINRY